jgi:hypothetical protein
MATMHIKVATIVSFRLGASSSAKFSRYISCYVLFITRLIFASFQAGSTECVSEGGQMGSPWSEYLFSIIYMATYCDYIGQSISDLSLRSQHAHIETRCFICEDISSIARLVKPYKVASLYAIRLSLTHEVEF